MNIRRFSAVAVTAVFFITLLPVTEARGVKKGGRNFEASECTMSAPDYVEPFDRLVMNITYTNTGTTKWYGLNVLLEEQSKKWFKDFVTTNGHVRTGKSHTYTFRGRAPWKPGIYEYEWRLKSWSGFFGPTCTKTIYVGVPLPEPEIDSTLTLTTEDIGTEETVLVNTKNVNLMRFKALATGTDQLLVKLSTIELLGDAANFQNYALWVDTDNNNAVDTIIEDGLSPINGHITFADISGGGYVLPEDTPVYFEVHANAVSVPQELPYMNLELNLPSTMNAEELESGELVDEIVVGNEYRKVVTVETDEVATLAIKSTSVGLGGNVAPNTKDISMAAFKAYAEGADQLLTEVVVEALVGDIRNATNFTLLVDTDGDLTADSILETGITPMNGKVTFANLAAGGFVLPEDSTILFQINADAVAVPQENRLLGIVLAQDGVEAEELASGTSIEDISYTGGDTKVITLVEKGNLYVTQDYQYVRNHQLLGGKLTDSLLRLNLRAENEDINVTKIAISASGSDIIGDQSIDAFRSVDRLELYKDGATIPFATATRAGCGADTYAYPTMCAVIAGRQLIIDELIDTDVVVRALMKSEAAGAISGDQLRLFVVPDSSAVEAVGDISNNVLDQNNGDNSADGEIFIGTNWAYPNYQIVGTTHQVVLAKITSIVNANTDANGTAIPTGVYPIGQFKMTAAAHNNSENGLNVVDIDDILFTVKAENVLIDPTTFKIYNKADPSIKHNCEYAYITGSNSTKIVGCMILSNGGINTEIEQGTSTTFVLEADISNPAVDPAEASSLDVSINFFNTYGRTARGVHDSHISWNDKDYGSSTTFYWIESPNSVIYSTKYSN